MRMWFQLVQHIYQVLRLVVLKSHIHALILKRNRKILPRSTGKINCGNFVTRGATPASKVFKTFLITNFFYCHQSGRPNQYNNKNRNIILSAILYAAVKRAHIQLQSISDVNG